MSPKLPPGWRYEFGQMAGQAVTRARRDTGRVTIWQRGDDDDACAATAASADRMEQAIQDGLIGPGAPPPSAHAGQQTLFPDLAPAQFAEDRHTHCPTHGTFYQPHCWHCQRRRPDRPHKRSAQS